MIALGGLMVGACGGEAPEVDIGPGVPLNLAQARAETISDLRYDVRFVLPASRSDAIEGQVSATFTWEGAGPVAFDFAAHPDQVRAVRVGGTPVEAELRSEHLIVPLPDGAGPVTVEIDFTAGDGSLNRQDDFLYTLFVPDRARVALPLFDQPNLKARFRLQLDVPAGWRAVANGSLASREDQGDRALLTFSETDPISSYLFAFAAGEFQVEEAERDGRRMAMYHRETDRERVERNAGAIFDLHASALAWLEEYTGIPFPFEKFDFVLVPAFQYGGMEHPGAMLYRADALLLDESATQNAYLGRASVIAHETAHQWFGDLVTMTWFNDVWMKETFANFMAAKIVNPAFPEVNHELRFLLAHHPAAYGIDRTAGANPIRQPLDNLNEAGTLYGAIIYQKAPIVFAHLERLIGEAALRDGLREYLAAHAYGNAGWAELIAMLDSRTTEDLVAWSRTWVEESGRPRVEVALATDGETITELAVRQSDPSEAGRVWNQRLDLRLGYGGDASETMPVHLRGAMAVAAEAAGRPAPDYVLANGSGLGYGLMALDPRTRDYLLAELPDIDDALTRAIAWVSLWELLLEGDVDPEGADRSGAPGASGGDGRTERLAHPRLSHLGVLALPESRAADGAGAGDRDAAVARDRGGGQPQSGRGLVRRLPQRRAVHGSRGATGAHLARRRERCPACLLPSGTSPRSPMGLRFGACRPARRSLPRSATVSTTPTGAPRSSSPCRRCRTSRAHATPSSSPSPIRPTGRASRGS